MTSVYLINRTPSTVLSGLTPYERLYTCAPFFGHLRTFGCVCFVLLPSIERTKLSPRSVMCIFLGYSETTKGYRLYKQDTNEMIISRDVHFAEEEMWPFNGENETTRSVVITEVPVEDSLTHSSRNNESSIVPEESRAPRYPRRIRVMPTHLKIML